MPYIIMLLSSVFGIAEFSMMKQYEKKYKSGRFLYLTILTLFASIFFLVTDKDGLCFEPMLIFYGLLSGLFYCASYYLTFIAYANGSFALTNLIISFSLISSVGYGLIFLNDKLSVCGYIGLALIFISLLFINFPQKGSTGKISFKWLAVTLCCFVGNSGITIVRKIQQIEFGGKYDNEYSLLMVGSSFLVYLLLSIIKERNEWKGFFTPTRLYAVGSGICNGAQNLGALLVNGMMIISLAGPLMTAITMIMSFSVSLIFFKEKFSRYQIIGAVVGIISIVLLSI